MAKYVCEVCDFIFDEEKEGIRWEDLPEEWVCPVCDSPKRYYHKVEAVTGTGPAASVESEPVPDGYLRSSDEVENWMADIHRIASSGESIIEPMRTADPQFSWDNSFKSLALFCEGLSVLQVASFFERE